ncbi:hypothetical protein CPB84DRAFT_1689263 [Gymnopilus junonius]|uniref:BTB domain-containing protein n=1 Tax=Gymnopilus junonius TaxID=109634 RepID=A0A9P5THM3_GYMJU|nr:hypothetical protein CPB84DRAFT_1689263 [Gymnopilus junonius]
MPVSPSSSGLFRSGPTRKFIIVDAHTIREVPFKQEEARSKKRQRVEEEADNVEEERSKKNSRFFSLNTEDVSLQRDSAFFFHEDETANVYICVEETLFKIHEERLNYCQFMVEQLHQHVRDNGLTSETNAVRFVPPTLEEYRAFLWTLYASAEELESSPDQDYVSKLYQLLSLSSKYDMPKHSQWVRETLHKTIEETIYVESCSSAALVDLTETCINFQLFDTLSIIIDKWCKLLEAKSESPSVPAMQLADKYVDPSADGNTRTRKRDHDWGVYDLMKRLQGTAYYVHIQSMVDRCQPAESSSSSSSTSPTAALRLLPDPKLHPTQIMRVLRGYWSLTSTWERLRLHPTPLPRSTYCSAEHHSTRCVKTWERRWVAACGWQRILGIGGADVLALVECLRDELDGDEELKGAGTTGGCRVLGLEGLRELRARMKEGLADYFVDTV